MDFKIINNIKSLGIDMINRAGSGHPGIVLGAAPVIYTVFARHLNINVKDTNWANRDRFVLSAGHGSALLYSTLYMAGYDLNVDDLKSFRQLNSKTPGHPEYGHTSGVEATTGPLGQGIANAVGMAIAGKLLNKKDSLLNYKVYVLCSDGDLMEGVANEALSLAGSLHLDNLIVLHDSNDICLDGKVSDSFKEDITEKYKAMGFHTDFVLDGNEPDAIDNAIIKAKKINLPSFIEIKTIIGDGSKYENTNTVHGKPLEEGDYINVKKDLGYNGDFEVNIEARNHFMDMIKERGLKKYNDYHSIQPEKNINLDNLLINLNDGEMRNLNNKVINEIAKQDEEFLTGSADLFSSTKTNIEGMPIFNGNNYSQNIAFGVREHAMAAISNGIALSGFKVSIATFLAFADYLKPALRLSSIMQLPVTYIFSHDSVTVGSDGPTHQPIEQLAMLRSTPMITTFKPADASELIGAWEYIYSSNKPNCLIISKEKVNKLKLSSKEDTKKGAYIISPENNVLHGIIISAGYELHEALKLKEELFEKESLDLRVVSMPSMELFLKQDVEYQEKIIPNNVRKVVIEYASSFGWHRFVYNDNYLITADTFGYSGNKEDVLSEMKLDYESMYQKIKKLLK